eukprot:181715-Amorphochlora_amoeboformis.AAC.2
MHFWHSTQSLSSRRAYALRKCARAYDGKMLTARLASSSAALKSPERRRRGRRSTRDKLSESLRLSIIKFHMTYPISTRRRLKTLDALVSFFKEKSALDQYYSRTLKKLARVPLQRSPSILDPISNLSHSCLNLALSKFEKQLHLMEHETPGSPLQAFLHGFRDLIETISTNYEILAAKEIDQMLNPLNR